MQISQFQEGNYDQKSCLPQKCHVQWIIVKQLYHWFDLGTDIWLVYDKYQTIQTLKNANTREYILQVSIFCVLIFFLIFDRISTYFFFIGLEQALELSKQKNPNQQNTDNQQRQIQQQQIQNNNNVQNKKDIALLYKFQFSRYKLLKFFLFSIFYLDYVIIYEKRKTINIESYLIKKASVELYCENIIFAVVGFITLFLQNIVEQQQQHKLDILIILGFISSLLSTVYVLYEVYIYRIEKQEFIIQRNDIKLQDLSLKTQIFILFPISLQQQKFVSGAIDLYPDLFKEFYHQKNDQQNQVINNNTSLRSTKYETEKESQNQKQKKTELSTVKKIYLNIYLFMYIISLLGTFALSYLTEDFHMTPIIASQISYILFLPQTLGFIYKKIQYSKSFKNILSIFVINVLFSPVQVGIAFITFMLPSINTEIPLIPEIKEDWLINLFPTWYKLIFHTIYMIFIQIIVYLLMFNHQYQYGNKEFIYSSPQFRLENMNQKGKVFLCIYCIIATFTIIITLLHIIYLFNLVYQNQCCSKKLETLNNIKKEEEKGKQNETDNSCDNTNNKDFSERENFNPQNQTIQKVINYPKSPSNLLQQAQSSSKNKNKKHINKPFFQSVHNKQQQKYIVEQNKFYQNKQIQYENLKQNYEQEYNKYLQQQKQYSSINPPKKPQNNNNTDKNTKLQSPQQQQIQNNTKQKELITSFSSMPIHSKEINEFISSKEQINNLVIQPDFNLNIKLNN